MCFDVREKVFLPESLNLKVLSRVFANFLYYDSLRDKGKTIWTIYIFDDQIL